MQGPTFFATHRDKDGIEAFTLFIQKGSDSQMAAFRLKEFLLEVLYVYVLQ